MSGYDQRNRCVFSFFTKNDTDVAHYNSMQVNQFELLLAEMLMREYAIKRWFVIPPLLTNVSALPGETWTPENSVFSVILYIVSRKGNGWVSNNICTLYGLIVYKKLLKLVDECWRYSKPKQCCFWDTVYSMTEKTTITLRLFRVA